MAAADVQIRAGTARGRGLVHRHDCAGRAGTEVTPQTLAGQERAPHAPQSDAGTATAERLQKSFRARTGRQAAPSTSALTDDSQFDASKEDPSPSITK
jgi:hypothetical protein